MKTLKELRTVLDFYPHQLNSHLGFFARNAKIDFDVFLESKGFNLQRGFVWSLDQKRELIWSIFMRRHIPRMAMVFTVDDVYKVVDGKQRLSAMLDFYNNKFTLLSNGKEYYYKDLPTEHQRHLEMYGFPYDVYNEEYGKPLKDEQLIMWFKFINFAGTPQDLEHLKKLDS